MGQNSMVDQKRESVENFIYFLNNKERVEKMNTVLDLQMKFPARLHPRWGVGKMKIQIIA